MESSRVLSPEHARKAGVDRQWEDTNEAWWDWYLSLADRADTAPAELEPVAPPPPAPALSAQELAAELAEPYPLAPEHVERFRADGFIRLPSVLSPGALAIARAEVAELSAAQGAGPGASGFQSMDMMWQASEVLRAFTLAPRLGRLAADLLEVADVRLYHDNVLSKAPGCGRTPWHFDAHHFPIAGRNVVTSWIPLQAIPARMGPLAFAAGADTWRLADGVDFNARDDSYDRGVAEAFRAAGVRVVDEPFALGEASFHHAWCFHFAGPNGTTAPRTVLSDTYFEDGAPLVSEATMVSGDWQKFMPGAQPGEPIRTPMNPVVSRA